MPLEDNEDVTASMDIVEATSAEQAAELSAMAEQAAKTA